MTGPDEADRMRHEISTLEVAVASRTLLGQATGLLAARLNLPTDRAWQILIICSMRTNLKVATVARLVVTSHDGRMDADDTDDAARLAAELGTAVVVEHERNARRSRAQVEPAG